MSSLAQKHVQQTAELSKNLETMTEAHSKASRDLQTLIAKQHDLSLRWKLDTQGLTSHYERQMSDCRAQIAKLQERIIEYEDAVRWEAKGRKEAAGQVEMERRMVEKARAAMRSLEEKCERLLQQNEELVKRGDATLSEKKILERDVDRLKLEIARLERERTKQRSQPPTHRPILRYDDGSSDSETNIKALKAEIERVKNRSRARDSPGIETLLRLREAGHHGRESYGRSRTSSGSSTGGDLSGSS
ncbi:hypothetical protein DFJ73DRAFT_41855 [Zopfochytrium polystomum]|nr:hypothetical protein DFJ73DRAFT_41855 [Zopfochytrium polystomum]